MRFTKLYFAGMAFLSLMTFSAAAAPFGLLSPDGQLKLNVDVDAEGVPFYNLSYKDIPVIQDSRLGLSGKETSLEKGFRITDHEVSQFDETWQPVWGEYAEIRDRHNELAVTLEDDKGQQMIVRFRLFDDGLGFRYELPLQEKIKGNYNFLLTAYDSGQFIKPYQNHFRYFHIHLPTHHNR